MEEISVRVRGKSNDVKITLNKSKNKSSIFGFDGYKRTATCDYNGDRYKDFSNIDIIEDYIKFLNKENDDNYKIIQNPWLEKKPTWRSFGFDTYYLNNETKLIIKWILGNNLIGGKEWSDDDGNELDIKRGETEDYKRDITKEVTILTPSVNIYITKSGFDYDLNNSKTYSGSIKDNDIINEILTFWKMKISNYDINICSPNNTLNNTLIYKNPIDIIIDEELETKSTDEKIDEKIDDTFTFNVESENIFKILTSKSTIDTNKIGDLEIYDDSGDFVFQSYDDSSELDDIYQESDFEGEEETSIFEEQEYSEEERIEVEKESNLINENPYVEGKHKLDLISGSYKGNTSDIFLCQIHGKPINIKIANELLDMLEAAKNDGVGLKVTSGFRPGYKPDLNIKSKSGVTVKSQSQESLYIQNCKNGVCTPATAKAGTSKHGTGIAVDFNTGSRGASFKPLRSDIYKWLIKNSWKYGFVRTVKSEEWHFEYWVEAKKKGPYTKLDKNNKLYYSDLGLNNINIS